MNKEEYIKQKNTFYAQNISDFNIGDKLDDNGFDAIITNKTSNTIEVFITAKTSKGISYKQWFDMFEFNKRFKTIK